MVKQVKGLSITDADTVGMDYVNTEDTSENQDLRSGFWITSKKTSK
jgi:hypothetical protein